MTNPIRQEAREEFRAKFGQFYVSIDAKTKAIRIVDIENGIRVNGEDGTEIECVASGDIEKYIDSLITRTRLATLEEVKGMVEEHHQTELVELSGSNNSKETKEHIRKGIEIYKTQLLTRLSEAKNKDDITSVTKET